MFTIRFNTIRYRPDLQVTTRNGIDGWDQDLPGEYENDKKEIPITAAEWGELTQLQDAILAEVGGVALPGNDLAPNRDGLGGVAREVSTLRMGTDPGTGFADGVLDANLKLLEYDNLYACDQSVFPTSPAANPTVT